MAPSADIGETFKSDFLKSKILFLNIQQKCGEGQRGQLHRYVIRAWNCPSAQQILHTNHTDHNGTFQPAAPDPPPPPYGCM